MILFFDTETSGLTRFKLPVDHPEQPHIAQLAAVLCEDTPDCTVRETYCAFIKPDGWFIEEDAFNVHGISTDYCFRFGEALLDVMRHFERLVRTCASAAEGGRLVGHNVSFDVRMAVRETYTLPDFDPSFINLPTAFCTMRAMTPICRLPARHNPRQHKWPKLQEAYKFVFDREFDGAHGALEDTLACREIFVEGRRRGWWS